jgi:cytochrome c-type biogenesis protein CcmH/NrfG
MSENNQSVKTGWSAVQVYTLSAICLLIGITMGYLFRGSNAPQAPAAAMPTTSSNPAGGLPANPSQPTPEAMKRMADKQVAPLLDQLKTNPKDAETLRKVAHYYMVSQQYKDAATYYGKETEVKPSADAYTQLGIADYYAGSTDEAINALNQALKIDPNYANALYNLGMLKWQVQGDSKGAVAEWEQLVKTNPKHPQIEQVKKLIAKAKQHENMPAGTKTDKPAM